MPMARGPCLVSRATWSRLDSSFRLAVAYPTPTPSPLLSPLSPSSSSRPARASRHANGTPFSTGTGQRILSTELRDADWRALRVRPDRLWGDIHGSADKMGGLPEHSNGLSRLSLTPSDTAVRAWFRSTTEALSCTVRTDAIGNIFAIRPGLDNSLPATFAGSHLDSQPSGGRFDGVLGVCAGIEMLRLLEENWIETVGPVGVVNWTNEEGARFPCSMMGSGVWSGAVGEERALGLREVGGGEGGGRTVRGELEGMGIWRGKEGIVDASWETGVRLGAHFELHIEQGPHLVGAGEKVGVVEGAQAYRWYEIKFVGRDCHTGTTSFGHRADALLAAASAIVGVRAVAEEVGDGALASVGIIEAKPGSVNTVPGYVKMSLDLRCPQERTLEELEAAVKQLLRSVGEPVEPGMKSVQVDMKEIFRSDAVRFQKEAVECVEAAAKNILGSVGATQAKPLMRRMVSGAGHDSVFTNRRCPTAMVFVPCKDGISHHPEEWCDKDDCAIGASVLTQAVLRFDQTRK